MVHSVDSPYECLRNFSSKGVITVSRKYLLYRVELLKHVFQFNLVTHKYDR